MRRLLFLFMLLQVGCATKYIIPGNRFMTPETQGGSLESSAEFQQSQANQLTSDVRNGSVKDGVLNSVIKRSGFLFATSWIEQIDVFWNHTGAGNSLIGGKYQFFGASRIAKGAGHKMAISLAIGGNQHETDGSNRVRFELTGKEVQLLYGYRVNEYFLAYSNLAYGKYDFAGTITSNDPSLNGLKPAYTTQTLSLYGGSELTLGPFFGKAELGYQLLQTTYTKNVMNFVAGYSLGFNW